MYSTTNIQNIVNNVLGDYQGDKINLNCIDLAKYLNINFFETTFISTETFGYIIKDKYGTSIYLNENISPLHKNISIATLLGNHLLDDNYEKYVLKINDLNVSNKSYLSGLSIIFNDDCYNNIYRLFNINYSNILLDVGKIEQISKYLNLSFSHTYAFFNININ